MTTTASNFNAIITGKPYINEESGRRHLQFNDEAIQSEMLVTTPSILSLDYTQKLMCFLLFFGNPQNLTMIGLGGGSLAKYCYKKLPFGTIKIAEINAEVIALRNEFYIPVDDERFSVHCVDGAEFVAQLNHSEDVIIVDGFDITGQPLALCSQDFYDCCYAALSENGVLAINLADDIKKHALFIKRIRRSFDDCVIHLKTSDLSNKIIFAFKNKNTRFTMPELLKTSQLLMEQHDLNFRQFVIQILSDFQNIHLFVPESKNTESNL